MPCNASSGINRIRRSTAIRTRSSSRGPWPDAFYPPGYFEGGQGLSGTARLYGDVEYRGQDTNRNAGSFFGFVDTASQSVNIEDVTVPPPYAWRD